MNLLLEKYVLLWFVSGDERLSAAARAAISDPANRRWVSASSLWEIAIKWSLERFSLGSGTGTPRFDRGGVTTAARGSTGAA